MTLGQAMVGDGDGGAICRPWLRQHKMLNDQKGRELKEPVETGRRMESNGIIEERRRAP